MTTQYSDLYGRMPRKLMIYSFIITMIVDFMPFAHHLFWLPEATILMLIYWLINRPKDVNIGLAFGLGLLMDVGTVSLLGSHTLAYSVCAYLIVSNQRQFGIQNYGFQAVAVLIALLCNEAILAAVRLIRGGDFLVWQVVAAPLVGALVWPILNKIMLTIIHAQRFGR